jgi:hypothetical protein
MFTPQQVQTLSSPRTYVKGLVYFLEGAVGGVWQSGTRYTSWVKGSEWYEQHIDFGQAEASCSCPMGQKSRWCKHLVAAGLVLTTGKIQEGQASGAEMAETLTFAEIKRALHHSPAPTRYAFLTTSLNQQLAQKDWLAAFRWLLAGYEVAGESNLTQTGTLPETWSQPLTRARDQWIGAIQKDPPPSATWKWLQDLWFYRWNYWEERYLPDRPNHSLRYRSDFHQPLWEAFRTDPISAHYLLMKSSGYQASGYI